MSGSFSPQLFSAEKFLVVIDRFPDLKFSAKAVKLPEVSSGSSNLSLPNTNVPIISDKINYGDLGISFLLEEDFVLFKALIEWITQAKDCETFTQAQEAGLYSDISILLYSNKNNLIQTINVTGCFPITISLPELDTNKTGSTTLDVTFECTEFSFDC